jgi:hypothetical protein
MRSEAEQLALEDNDQNVAIAERRLLEGSDKKPIVEAYPEGRIELRDGAVGGMEAQLLDVAMKQHDELASKESKYHEIIAQLQHHLEAEKKVLRDLRGQKTHDNFEKSELREQFLNCIEEVRKDIVRRRVQTAADTKLRKTFQSRADTAAARRKDLRSTWRPTAPMYGTQRNLPPQVEDSDPRPKLGSFTARDRRYL